MKTEGYFKMTDTHSKSFFRFHLPHQHLSSAFGDDWFAQKAEMFARFFGTPLFLILQTMIVAVWMTINFMGFVHFDEYPFIFLTLLLSLQASYAAPLILLAQNRQDDRDRVMSQEDRSRDERNLAVTEFMVREIAAMRKDLVDEIKELLKEQSRTQSESDSK